MKFYFCLVFVLPLSLYFSNIFGQNTSVADSLIALAVNMPDDTNKINRYFDISFEFEKTDPPKAIKFLYKALDLSQRLEKPAKVSVTLEDLGYIYMYRLARYDSAEYCYSESVRMRKATLGDRNYDVSHALNGLAMCYNKMAQYEKSEKTFLEALDIIRENRGEENSDYALALSNLAVLYDEIGKYEKAEVVMQRALEIRKKVLGTSHKYYATSLNNMAAFYYKIGYYEKAETLYLEALEVWKICSGDRSLDYAKTLNNLANLYKITKKYNEALPLLDTALTIVKLILGDEHPDYATAINVKASVYLAKEDYEYSGPLFQQALEIRKNKLGENHPSYFLTLNNLAYVYLKTNRISEAESMFLMVAATSLKIMGENHPIYPSYLTGPAQLYEKKGELEKAEKYYLESIRLKEASLFRNFSFMSEKEKEAFFKTQFSAFSNFYSFALNRKTSNPAITGEVYNHIIRNKGILLRSSTAMRSAILNSNDSSLTGLYQEWSDLKKEISKLNSTEVSKRKKDPGELEQKANEIEKELVKRSQFFSDYEKSNKISWVDVKNNLKEGEAAVEFVRFVYSDTMIYCALVVDKSSVFPKMIRLFSENEIENCIDSLKNASSLSYINNLYGKKGDAELKLYHLIFSPLEKELKSIKTIYISPDGVLHKISFPAIGKSKNTIICDNFSIIQLSSTGSLSAENSSKLEDFSAAVFGGVNYNADSVKAELWQYLPGTLTEKTIIENLFASKGISVKAYKDLEASEVNLKQLFAEKSNPPSILHISTHGYFNPDPEEQNLKPSQDGLGEKDEIGTLAFRGTGENFGLWQFVKNPNPLIRSGLVLAGANQVWLEPYSGTDNEGVLTALEVSNLNMTGTNLVVLSACETGLGDIKGSEGVYGLQRAFKMAGVKYIIMSLWQVPDKETVEFMETFYRKLLKSKDVRTSFNETQKEMRKKYDPYFWAAFVLIE